MREGIGEGAGMTNDRGGDAVILTVGLWEPISQHSNTLARYVAEVLRPPVRS